MAFQGRSKLIYLAIIPMTVAFCFVMYLFSVALPRQLQSTRLGKAIWPTLTKLWYFLFLTIAFGMMAGQILQILAKRLEWADVASWALMPYLYPPSI